MPGSLPSTCLAADARAMEETAAMKTAERCRVKSATASVKSAAPCAVESASSAAAGVCEVRQGDRRNANQSGDQNTFGASPFAGRLRLRHSEAAGHGPVHVNCSSMSAVIRTAHEVLSRMRAWTGIRRVMKSPLIRATVRVSGHLSGDRSEIERKLLRLPCERRLRVEPHCLNFVTQ
jgi:hypothetical protein